MKTYDKLTKEKKLIYDAVKTIFVKASTNARTATKAAHAAKVIAVDAVGFATAKATEAADATKTADAAWEAFNTTEKLLLEN